MNATFVHGVHRPSRRRLDAKLNEKAMSITFEVIVDGHKDASETFGLSDITNFCARAPISDDLSASEIHKTAEICIGFDKIQQDGKHFTACADLKAEVMGKKIVQAQLGCFTFDI